MKRENTEYPLLNGQGMRAWDGVAIEECEELAESVEEGPVREQADTLVGVDWARAAVCGAAGASGHTAGGRGFVWVGDQETQLGKLLISQALLWVGLIELNGSTVNLVEEK